MTVVASTNSRSVLASFITDMYSAASLSVAVRSMLLQADVLFNPISLDFITVHLRVCKNHVLVWNFRYAGQCRRAARASKFLRRPQYRRSLSLIHISEPTRL